MSVLHIFHGHEVSIRIPGSIEPVEISMPVFCVIQMENRLNYFSILVIFLHAQQLRSEYRTDTAVKTHNCFNIRVAQRKRYSRLTAKTKPGNAN